MHHFVVQRYGEQEMEEQVVQRGGLEIDVLLFFLEENPTSGT